MRTQMSEMDAADGECLGSSFIHYDNLGLYDSGEVTDYYAPFSPCDLVMISVIKAMSIIQVRTSKSSFTPPLPYLSHSIHSYRPSHSYPFCHCPRTASIIYCLNFYVGLFIVLPASTFFSHDFILGVWPDGTLTDRNDTKSLY